MKLSGLLKENKKVVKASLIGFLSGWLIMGTLDNYLRKKYEGTPTKEIGITASVMDSKDKAVIGAILGIYEKRIEGQRKRIYFYQKFTDYLMERAGLNRKRNLERTSQDRLYKL